MSTRLSPRRSRKSPKKELSGKELEQALACEVASKGTKYYRKSHDRLPSVATYTTVDGEKVSIKRNGGVVKAACVSYPVQGEFRSTISGIFRRLGATAGRATNLALGSVTSKLADLRDEGYSYAEAADEIVKGLKGVNIGLHERTSPSRARGSRGSVGRGRSAGKLSTVAL